MMYARIVDNVAQEVVDFDPATHFHADVAKLFVPVPEGVKQGSMLLLGVWTAHLPKPESAPCVVPVVPGTVGPIAFQLRLSINEQVVLDALRDTDPVIKVLFKLLDDPRTDVVDLSNPTVQAAIQYATSLVYEHDPALATRRAAELLV
jgi:hypothetical protein